MGRGEEVIAVDVTIGIPGGHGRLHFPGDSWPPLDVLVEQAEGGAEAFRRCPTCRDVPVADILLAMAEQAPPDLAAGLRELAGERREPSDAEKALAASYERYADQLAEIEALRAGR